MQNDTEDRTCELFVGNLVKEGMEGDHNEDNLRLFFEQFGVVTDVDIKRDNHGLSKGFAFVRFMDQESIDAVLKNYEHNIVGGVWLDCKRSVDRSQRDPPKGGARPPPNKGGAGGLRTGGSSVGGKGGGGLAARGLAARGAAAAHPSSRRQPVTQIQQQPMMTAGMMPQQQQGMLAAALLHPSVCPPGMVPGWVPIGDPNAMSMEELGLATPSYGMQKQMMPKTIGHVGMQRPRPY